VGWEAPTLDLLYNKKPCLLGPRRLLPFTELRNLAAAHGNRRLPPALREEEFLLQHFGQRSKLTDP
jgi:hypothetical protein